MRLGDVLAANITADEYYETVKDRYREQHQKLVEIASYIREKEPELADEIIHNANQAMEGMLVLPGSGGKPIFVGNPPKWKTNPTPSQDIEAVYVMNRMEHWNTLMQAYLLTGTECYARKVVDELTDWLIVCPCPDIRPDDMEYLKYQFDSKLPEQAPWRSLEAGFRMFLSWYHIPAYLAECPLFTPDILEKLMVAVYEHAEVFHIVSPLFYPEADHNHYLMEMLGLLFACCEFPEIKAAEEWREQALHELERCAYNQLTEDGGQIEGCPMYHNECCVLFARSILEAGRHGYSFSGEYTKRFQNALIYVLHSCRPDGRCMPLGDSDAAYTPAKSGFYGYLALGDDTATNAIKYLQGEAVFRANCISYLWETENVDETIALLDKKAVLPKLPLFSHQRKLQQAILRSSWERDAFCLLFSCRTPVQNTHAHIDPGAFELSAYGKTFLTDPGRYTYNEIPERYEYKSAHSHNTITVNGQEPFEYISSWEYGEQKPGTLVCAAAERMECIQENFQPVIHKRILLPGIEDEIKYLLVVDCFDGLKKDDTVELHYHLDTTLVKIDGSNLHGEISDGTAVDLRTCSSLQGKMRSGHVSDAMDIQRDSIVADFCETECCEEESRIFATVIVPSGKASGTDIGEVIVSEDCVNFDINGKKYTVPYLDGKGKD